jgi:hypothetical protein
MKKLALISTYCDNEEKLRLLQNNITKLKEIELDVLIYTPVKLPSLIYDLCDYVIISKENPVLYWPEKSYWGWRIHYYDGKKIQLNTTYPDHGYACLNQFKKMGIYGLSMEYDIYYPMIYDLEINDTIIELIDKNLINSFFPTKRNDDVWDVGLHFFSLDRNHLHNFTNIITKKSYLENTSWDALIWMESKIKQINCVVEKQHINELYTILDESDNFNNSLFEDVHFFIQINGDDFIKILFYNFDDTKKIKIETESFSKIFEVKNWDLIEFDKKKFEKLIITIDDKTIDHTEILEKITHNSIEITDI